ncbi:MAG: hypothetical protein ABI867_19075 [Kofleriaceae bacterium]
MRIIVLYLLALVFTLIVLPSPILRAEGYIEKKDREAIEVIERSLAKLDKAPALFDGTKIPAGADLQAVDALLGQLTLHLRAASGSFSSVSDKGMQRPEVVKLKAKFDDLTRYRDALAPAYAKASTEAESNARQQHADHQSAVKAANEKCGAWRKEVSAAKIHSELEQLHQLATSGMGGWGNAADGARHKAALVTLDGLCKKPAYTDVGKACELASNVRPVDVDYCSLPARSSELMKLAVKNEVEHHIKHSGPTTAARFESDHGWVQIDGFISWKDYFTGKQVRELLKKRIAPMLVQAEMAATDADVLFDKLAASYAALEAKAKELGPTWDLPGDACAGAGCAQAKTFVSQWYSGAPIRRFTQTRPGWKILTNEAGIPTYRERYGYALVQVKGDPLCQLRMWTLSEQYAGGGRYTAARDVSLGFVRWQTCK